jgi:hypothetical protein
VLDQVSETAPLKELLSTCACRLLISDAAHRLLKGQAIGSESAANSRRFPRYAMQGWGALEYRSTFPSLARAPEMHAVLLVNLSRGGLAFLHSEQLYPHEQLKVTLPDGTSRSVSVTRCQWLGPSCFMAGGEFRGKS